MIVQQEITVHAIKCEVCDKLFHCLGEDYSPWVEDTEWIDDALPDSDWGIEEDKHYCPSHWEWSDDGESIIAKTDKAQEDSNATT